MKKLLVFFVFSTALSQTRAQVSVSADGSSPHASAMLDIKSTNKGMLVPRTSTALRTAIPSPADGLMVYDTDTQSFWYYKSGTGWVNTAGASLWAPNGANAYNTNAGNIGINTTTPASPLTLKTSGIGFSQEGPDGDQQIGFYTDNTSAWLQTHTKSNMYFSTNNSNMKMVLDTLDNVGIGSFDFGLPQARLEVKGNGGMGTTILASNSNNFTGTGATQGVTGVQAELTSTSGGNFSAALRGINRSTTGSGIGVVGYQAGSGWGLYGEAPSGRGIYALTATGTAGYFNATASGYALQTFGKIAIQGNGAADGKVLTSDASGNATWEAPVAASRSHTIVLGPSAFFGREDVPVRKHISIGGASFSAAVSGGQLYAPLQLPVGASITSVTFWQVDNHPTNDYTFAISREWAAANGFNGTAISLPSSGANSSPVSLTHTFPTPPVVSGGVSYYITMTGNFTGNLLDAYLKSVLITYTY